MTERVVLTPAAAEGFITRYLLPDYDRASPIKWFHREWLDLACLPDPLVALGAPRGHSKSVTFNIGYSLAAAMIRSDPYQLKLSRTRPIAIEFLRTVKDILINNDLLREDFGILPVKQWERDTEDDFICCCEDGYRFRMIALGAEQPMRGISWNTKRPTLIICDDMEDDEQVLSMERREKVRKWFMGTLLPIGTVDTKFRVVGTVLHAESLLKGLLESEAWTSKVYEACDDDVSAPSILWPELFPPERLLKIKQNYAEQGNLVGFNMEYRNIAIDTSSGYFQPQDFRENDGDVDEGKPKTYYVGVDFAISTAERRDYSVMFVGGIDEEGFLHIVDLRRGRWDAMQLIDEMFAVEEAWHPEMWFVESGAIQKALLGGLEMEQRKRRVFLNLRPMVPTKDKMSRARSIQARMRSGSVLFDKRMAWFHNFEQEMLQFPRGRHDDQVDAIAWLGLGLANMITPPTEQETDEMRRETINRMRQQSMSPIMMGRSPATGY